MASASIEEYMKQRNELIHEDTKLRRDCYTTRPRSFLENEAEKIIYQLRREEAESIWQEDHPDVLHPFPGMEFLTGRYSADDRFRTRGSDSLGV